MAARSAGVVIGSYSTSFSLAARALSPQVRSDIENLYAFARIADEIVDGAAEESGVAPELIAEELQRYREDTHRAIARGFSANPVLHAFAETSRRCGLDPEHIEAFFESMAQDISREHHDRQSLERYVYGSAEVIGMMCLAIFTAQHPLSDRAQGTCVIAARNLGRAFQKINFLRDYATDSAELGRHYLVLTPQSKSEFIGGIRRDLSKAYRGIAMLPLSARAGVLAAYLLFSELTDLCDAATISDIMAGRISVPNSRKALLAARALMLAPRMKAI